MKPRSFILRLAVQNLGRRPLRAVLLALAIAAGGGAVFTASVLRQAIQGSLGVGLDRLGADLMAVPRETNVNLVTALLTVEPTEHTLDPATVERLSRLPGVDRAAPQRYFAIPSADKTHGGQDDLIAFDPDRDFTVIPWLVATLDRPLRRGDVIVGGRRPEVVGGAISLFNTTLPVYGKLALTGVGPFERAAFVSFETIQDLAPAAQTVGRELAADLSVGRASALLIRLKVGATPEQFRFAAARFPEVQIVSGNGLNTSVRQTLTLVLNGAIVFPALTLLISTLMVGALYAGLLAERRRELGLLLAVGMRPAQLVRLVLAEAALTTGFGGVCGVVLGGAGLVLFQRSLGFLFERYQAPFRLPAIPDLILAGLASLLACCLVGAIGAAIPAWRAGRSEPYALIRGEGA